MIQFSIADFCCLSPNPKTAANYENDGERLTLRSNGTKECYSRAVSAPLPLQEAQRYRVQLELEVAKIQIDDLFNRTHALVNWIDAQGTILRRDYLNGLVDGEYPALYAELDAPDGAASASVEIALKWTAHGSLTLRRAHISPMPPKPSKKIRVVSAFTAIPENFEGNTAAILDLIDYAAREKPDLICLGETALSSDHLPLSACAVPIPGDVVGQLQAKAKQHNAVIVTGIAERDGDIFYNSAIVIESDGRIVGKYRKVHLPLAEVERGYSPGSDVPVFDTSVGKIGILICWDIMFPELARMLCDRGAELLCVPNYAYSELEARARASDNGVFLAISSPRHFAYPCRIIDPKGRVVAHCPGGEEHQRGLCVAEIDLAQRHHEYWFSLGPNYADRKSVLRKERRDDLYSVRLRDLGDV